MISESTHLLQNKYTSKRGTRGFTLIELVVVLTLVALLVTIAVPRYFGAIDVGREKVRQQNMSALRDALDKYYGDVGYYPSELSDLVTKHYLREIPIDPVTESRDWIIVSPSDSKLGAVFDVQPPRSNVVPLNTDGSSQK